FETFCQARHLHRWPTGRGESVLGWLLAPIKDAAEPALAEFAQRLGMQVQTDTLARAQITQRVLYEITYLASSTRDRFVFLVGVHRLLASLIDAENFYLALYDP
ncbi:bifunctional diguanylate cyclase/phosphodiesterase, partial [Pseudomonas sp. GW247-3R2A]